MLTYEIRAYPLPKPDPGEILAVPLLLEPGTIIGNPSGVNRIITNDDGALCLQIQTPKFDDYGPPVKYMVVFCPRDPNRHGAFLVPASADFGIGGEFIGMTADQQHAIVGTLLS